MKNVSFNQSIENEVRDGKDLFTIFDRVYGDEIKTVEIDSVGYNFLRPDGTLLWNRKNWFEWADQFKGSYALVKVGDDFYHIDKIGWLYPSNEYLQVAEKRFASGESPEQIFDQYNATDCGIATVAIYGLGWNYLRKDGTFVLSTWEYYCSNFSQGIAVVKLGKKYNFVRPDGSLVWEGEKWFKMIYYYEPHFKNGFARVMLQDGTWNFLSSDGTLIWQGEPLSRCSDFCNSFGSIYVEDKGWNLIRPDGSLVWKGEKWFYGVGDFEADGLVEVACSNIADWTKPAVYKYLTKDGELLDNKQ